MSVLTAARKAVANLHLSRKVVTQGVTAALVFVAALAVHRWHASLPAGYLPVVAGVIAGYLVPESKNAATPLATFLRRKPVPVPPPPV